MSAVPDPDRRTAIRRADAAAAVDVLARTIWGEARGESVRGMEAVASVVVNRVRRAMERGGCWWGSDIVGVCLKPWQFSCWNEDDLNRAKLLAVGPGDPVFDVCLRIARRAVAGVLDDPTEGATHYMTRRLRRAGWPPAWGPMRSPCAVIGNHAFYNDIE